MLSGEYLQYLLPTPMQTDMGFFRKNSHHHQAAPGEQQHKEQVEQGCSSKAPRLGLHMARQAEHPMAF